MREINLSTKIAVYPLAECSDIEKKLIAAANMQLKNLMLHIQILKWVLPYF